MRPLLFGLLMSSLASPALAVPSYRLSWDDCNVLVTNRNWSGPGKYVLLLSGTGFNGSYTQFSAGFAFDPKVLVPAWDFATADYLVPVPICHPTSMLTASQAERRPAYPRRACSARCEGGPRFPAWPRCSWTGTSIRRSFRIRPALHAHAIRVRPLASPRNQAFPHAARSRSRCASS
jgi:hypothetical protein